MVDKHNINTLESVGDALLAILRDRNAVDAKMLVVESNAPGSSGFVLIFTINDPDEKTVAKDIFKSLGLKERDLLDNNPGSGGSGCASMGPGICIKPDSIVEPVCTNILARLFRMKKIDEARELSIILDTDKPGTKVAGKAARTPNQIRDDIFRDIFGGGP